MCWLQLHCKFVMKGVQALYSAYLSRFFSLSILISSVELKHLFDKHVSFSIISVTFYVHCIWVASTLYIDVTTFAVSPIPLEFIVFHSDVCLWYFIFVMLCFAFLCCFINHKILQRFTFFHHFLCLSYFFLLPLLSLLFWIFPIVVHRSSISPTASKFILNRDCISFSYEHVWFLEGQVQYDIVCSFWYLFNVILLPLEHGCSRSQHQHTSNNIQAKTVCSLVIIKHFL